MRDNLGGKMAKCLITGGAGFVGSNLAFHLCQKHKVTVMDNLVRRGSELNIPKFKDYEIEFIHGDIRNSEDLYKLPKYDFILHCAAQTAACTGYGNPSFDIMNNTMGFLNILEKSRIDKSKLIFWSTNKVYNGDAINELGELHEQPTRYIHKFGLKSIPETFSVDGGNHSIYGLSKICADLTCQEWAKAFDIPIIINRFSCLAGHGQFGKSEQGWVAWFCIAALFNLPVTLYGFKGKQVRDVLFMPDICKLIDKQMEVINEHRGTVFNVGGGQFCNTSLLECILRIEQITEKKIKWTYDKKQRTADQCVYISDISKAKRLLKWEPKIGLEEGLIGIIDWVEKNEKELRKLYV